MLSLMISFYSKKYEEQHYQLLEEVADLKEKIVIGENYKEIMERRLNERLQEDSSPANSDMPEVSPLGLS